MLPNDHKTATRNEEIPFFDGVRGYAAVFVLLGHVTSYALFHIPILSSPSFAVDVFMIMSGFLMTQHYLLREPVEPWRSPKTWLAFYIRRFFRIAPLYYILLIPCFVWFNLFGAEKRRIVESIFKVVYDPTSSSLDWANIGSHLTFTFGLMPKYCSTLVIPDWSIGLEMQFYLVFPFLMMAAKRLNIVWLSIISAIISMASLRLFGVYVINPPKLLGLFPQPSFLPLKLALFVVGILIAWAWMEQSKRLTPRASVILICAVALASLNNAVALLTALLAILVLFYTEDGIRLGLRKVLDPINTVFSNRFTHILAELSYGIYLIHELFLVPIAANLYRHVWFSGQTGVIRFFILSAIVVPLSFCSAWILSGLVEKPGIRFGKRMVRLLDSRSGQIRRSAETLVLPQTEGTV